MILIACNKHEPAASGIVQHETKTEIIQNHPPLPSLYTRKMAGMRKWKGRYTSSKYPHQKDTSFKLKDTLCSLRIINDSTIEIFGHILQYISASFGEYDIIIKADTAQYLTFVDKRRPGYHDGTFLVYYYKRDSLRYASWEIALAGRIMRERWTVK